MKEDCKTEIPEFSDEVADDRSRQNRNLHNSGIKQKKKGKTNHCRNED